MLWEDQGNISNSDDTMDIEYLLYVCYIMSIDLFHINSCWFLFDLKITMSSVMHRKHIITIQNILL